MAEDVHQAAAVGADHALGAGRLERLDLVLDHGAGDFRLLDREGAAEAAAFRFVVLLRDLDLVQAAEQLAPGQMDAHFAAGGAGGMQDDGAVAAFVFRLPAEDIDQEIGEFVDARRERFGLRLARGSAANSVG